MRKTIDNILEDLGGGEIDNWLCYLNNGIETYT